MNKLEENKNYIEILLYKLFNAEIQSLNIGYVLNSTRIHLMLDLINLLDFSTYADEEDISAEDLVKYTRYYEQLLHL